MRLFFLIFSGLLLAGCTVLLPEPAPTVAPRSSTTPVTVERLAAERSTTAPTATARPTQVATATTRPTHTPTVTPSTTPTQPAKPTPTAESEQSMTVTDEVVEAVAEPFAVVGVMPDDVLNVRVGPGVSYDIVGELPPYAQDVRLTGDQAGSWVAVEYGSISGWVNGRFLAQQQGGAERMLASRSLLALTALREQSWERLAEMVDPELGLRFVTNSYMSDDDPIFDRSEVASLMARNETREWGSDFASGEPVVMSFADYYEAIVYPHDYLFCDVIGYNRNIITGNVIDNSREIYPSSQFVEYHFPGFNSDFGGLDYRTLRLVFVPSGDQLFLVAIVNNMWTP